MKSYFLVWFVAVKIISAQTVVSPRFNSLQGFEDANGITHLFYRLYSLHQSGSSEDMKNNIYHLIPGTNIDSFYLPDYSYYYPMMGGKSFHITGFKFWEDNPSKYIYTAVGSSYSLGEKITNENNIEKTLRSPQALVKRFDSQLIQLPGFGVSGIFLSPHNDSLLVANVHTITKSYDGGWTWHDSTMAGQYEFTSFSPYDSTTFFLADHLGRIYKSTDNGLSAALVDTNITYQNQIFEFDHNTDYIYRLTSQNGMHYLVVSNDKGNQFSWTRKYTSDLPIYISVDKNQSGKIILATGRKIFSSNDYGNTFNLLKVLPRKLVGVHQKAGSNIVYAATKYKLYRLENDSLFIEKQLPLPVEAASLLPLKVGNNWVFDDYLLHENCQWILSHSVSNKKIIGEVIFNNNKYFQFNDDFSFWGSYVRIDSASGYLFGSYDGSSENFVTDLLAEPGELIYPPENEIPVGMCDSITNINFSDTIFTVKHYTFFMAPSFSLGVGLGLLSKRFCEFGGIRSELKGAVIDGLVYGDTTLVSVKDEENIPQEFSLAQNYPNPFNPSTKIKFTIPALTPSLSRGEMVMLKVYDVLGREVATLVNEEKQPGRHEVKFDASSLSSGIYFYRLQAGSFIETKKMILLR